MDRHSSLFLICLPWGNLASLLPFCGFYLFLWRCNLCYLCYCRACFFDRLLHLCFHGLNSPPPYNGGLHPLLFHLFIRFLLFFLFCHCRLLYLFLSFAASISFLAFLWPIPSMAESPSMPALTISAMLFIPASLSISLVLGPTPGREDMLPLSAAAASSAGGAEMSPVPALISF